MKAVRLVLWGLLLAQPVLADPMPPLLLQAEGRALSPVCTGQDVRLEGNHNVLKPFGRCGSLLIKGVANQIELDLADGVAIRVEGSGNRVVYHAAAAAVVDLLGTDNAVTAELTPRPAAGASGLRLTGDDRAQALDCAGRSVSVEGSRALYLLRGGCKALSIHGNLVIVQAELRPGALVTVTGHGVRVGWMLAGPGKPPVPAVSGDGNHIERLSEPGGIAPR